MLPLGFVIFPYLIKLLLKIPANKNFLNYFNVGFFYGLGFLLIMLSWIKNPFYANEQTKNFAFLAISLPIFLSIFFGLGFSIFKHIKKFYYIIVFTPFILLFIEFIISNILYGFPWLTYSLVLSNNFLGFYFLKFFGTYVSSYLTLLIFIMPFIFIYMRKLEYSKTLIFIIHAPFLIVFVLLYIFNQDNKNITKEISIEVFQIFSPINNINKEIIEKDIINKIVNSESEYLLFAENNYPYLISDINSISIKNYIKDNQKVIIGSTTFNNNKFYNSFLFLEKNNIQIFDKKILVPFGEFLPFRKYLKFMEIITGDEDFTKGKKTRLINSYNINILPIVCYEIIFNKILNNINELKIDILVNITNDSWFGDQIGPYQHFYHSRMRALISNKYLIRVSNNGISAIIDNNGKIIESTDLNKKTSFKKLLQIKNSTYFGFVHKLFQFYLVFIILIYFILTKYRFKNDR